MFLSQEKQQRNEHDGNRLHDQVRIAKVVVEEFEHAHIQNVATRIRSQVSDGGRGDMPLMAEGPFFVEIKRCPDMNGIEDADGQHRAYAEGCEQDV